MAERTNYERAPMVHAHHLLMLCKVVGDHQRVADLMGVAYSTLTRYKAQEQCPKSVEKAAEFEIAKRSDKTNLPAPIPDETIILKVPQDKIDYLMIFLKGAGIKHARFRFSA